jgi:uncharacterized protein
MKRLSLVFWMLPLGLVAQTHTTITKLYAHAVKDSFEIYITTPTPIDPNKVYDVMYYCDANLKSGNKLREMVDDSVYARRVSHTIFVGVGHIGNYHVLRRRDYILPFINGADTAGKSENYGQVANFYRFLTTELMPRINGMYKTAPANNTILGHSLGGLFAFYCLFKNKSYFKNYYALSPALWIDKYSIYRFNQLGGAMPQRNLYFSAGGQETLNHIKKGTTAMEAFLQQQQYPGLKFIYTVHEGQTHNSQVALSLHDILQMPVQ